MNIRELAESDLGVTLEGDYSLPVVLVSPDGITINTSLNDDRPLEGQILYDTVRSDPETGEDIVVNNPVVSLRRSSLSRIPSAGENWLIRIPTAPSTTATIVNFALDPSRPPEGGGSIGFIRLYLRKVRQS